ncbi:hypothetical protein RRG08_029202 [Elysia crispata]|uniref:Uncharacterized protein n=1 Tax=Elysia crispata TaxID=231223 RepID=A0AAE1AJC7_9GAST|nr:hypothetical protein RRG08_029202 [Elysia crispata]
MRVPGLMYPGQGGEIRGTWTPRPNGQRSLGDESLVSIEARMSIVTKLDKKRVLVTPVILRGHWTHSWKESKGTIRALLDSTHRPTQRGEPWTGHYLDLCSCYSSLLI